MFSNFHYNDEDGVGVGADPPRNARVMFPTSQSADPVQLAARSFSNPNQKEEDLTVLK